jgi:hypothetical protein
MTVLPGLANFRVMLGKEGSKLAVVGNMKPIIAQVG